MRVEVSAWVESDLEAIADYIAQDNPVRAITFIRAIGQRFHAIGEAPLIYRPRPEIGDDARLATFGHYAILFRIVGQVVRIERVVYGARDLPALFYGEGQRGSTEP